MCARPGTPPDILAVPGILPTMKIAFPTRDYQTITGHFGKMKGLLVIDIADGAEVSREQRDMSGMPACGQGQGEKPKFVAEKLADCDAVIAGGMGASLVEKIEAVDTSVILTDIRMIDEATAAYLAGSMENKPELAHETRTRSTVQAIGRAPSTG